MNDYNYEELKLEFGEQECLVEAFFKEEAKKPPKQRSNACLISCPCPKCRPCYL